MPLRRLRCRSDLLLCGSARTRCERARRIVNRRHEVVYRNARAVGKHVGRSVGVNEDVVIADRA